MDTLFHLESPMGVLHRPPAEKENHLPRKSTLVAKHGGAPLGKENRVPPRKRVALKAVNGDAHLPPSPSAPAGAAKSGHGKATTRVALSNLTNTAAPSVQQHQPQQKPHSHRPASCSKQRGGTTVTAANGLSKRVRLSSVPDVEQPYPRKLAPVFDDDLPRGLPRNWTHALSRDIWATTPARSAEPLVDLDIAHLGLDPVSLPDSACLEEELLVEVPTLMDECSADLDRDLAEDAKCLAAELLAGQGAYGPSD